MSDSTRSSSAASHSHSHSPSHGRSHPNHTHNANPDAENAARSEAIERMIAIHPPTVDPEDDETTYLLQRDLHKAAIRARDRQKALEAAAAPTAAQSNQFLVAVYSALLLLTSVGNSIYFKKMLNHMENHVYFLNQLTSFVFVPIFAVVVAYQIKFTNSITPEMRAFPKSKFFIMGIFDAVCGVLTMFGAVHTAGSTQALLANSVIPVTMALSYFILKERFSTLQISGASVIMAGIGVVLWPQLVRSLSDSPDAGDSDDVPLFNFLFLLSVIPGALSSIYKESAFLDTDIDANYLQYWTALWQFILGFLLAPLNTMQFLGSQTVPWDRLLSAISDGTWCLMGYNVRVPPECESPGQLCDDCDGAWIPLVIYLIFNFAYNVFSILLIKYGSSTLMFIIMTLRLPLVQLAFSMPMFNDPPDQFAWTSGAGLTVILLGLALYRWPSKTEATEPHNLLMPGMLDNRSFFTAMRSESSLKLSRSAHQIRSALYSSLGVIDSPPTPYSPDIRKLGAKSPSSRSPRVTKAPRNASENGTKKSSRNQSEVRR